MGCQSVELDNPRWLALDAGGTRIRVAPVVVSPAGLSLVAPPLVEEFRGADGPGRVAQAAEMLARVARQQAWEGPHQVALAWAGAPTADGFGIERARYGPAIPHLVRELAATLKLAHAPCIHSDSRAALEGAMQGQSGTAYAVLSGSGLGEAFWERDRCLEREEFRGFFGSVADWRWRGEDGESWLRASRWWPLAGEAPAPVFGEALRALVEFRFRQIGFERLFLGGHFVQWLERNWIGPADFPFLAASGVQPLPSELALLGSVCLERRRLRPRLAGALPPDIETRGHGTEKA